MLIVDDNATNRTILKHYVETWGMVPTATAGGAEALERGRRMKIDPSIRETPVLLVVVDDRVMRLMLRRAPRARRIPGRRGCGWPDG